MWEPGRVFTGAFQVTIHIKHNEYVKNQHHFFFPFSLLISEYVHAKKIKSIYLISNTREEDDKIS